MIIDTTQPEFEDIPDTLNNEVLLERPDAGGFITCSQETAYLFAIATLEQQQHAGHNQYDYTDLDLAVCRKPDITDVAKTYRQDAQKKIDSLNIPEPAKQGFQSRIDNLLINMNATTLDDAIRIALQLPLDITNV